MGPQTAAILLIGNEILTGKVEEANAAFLAKELFSLGVSLRRVVIIPDDVEEIAEVLPSLAKHHDIVFTSGGVGPTHDDVTMRGVARAFNRPIVRHAALDAALKSMYGARYNNQVGAMAMVPEGLEIEGSTELRFPVMHIENVYVLPGIPELFRAKIRFLRPRLQGQPFLLQCLYLVLDESEIADILSRVAEDYPTVAIGSYPTYTNPQYRVKVTLESRDEHTVAVAAQALRAALPAASIVDNVTEPASSKPSSGAAGKSP